MAGRKELGDIIVEWRAPKYHPIDGYESSDISATPYFCGKFPTKVNLNLNGNTVLKFKVGGRAQWEIHGQVKRPGNNLTKIFRIKDKNGMASEKAERRCDVVITESNEDDVGPWYLIIWYKGAQYDDDKASDRRTVIE